MITSLYVLIETYRQRRFVFKKDPVLELDLVCLTVFLLADFLILKEVFT